MKYILSEIDSCDRLTCDLKLDVWWMHVALLNEKSNKIQVTADKY